MKTIKLKADSLQAKLFKWFYSLDDFELPNNLCDYVPNLILMWVLILPYSIISLPAIISEYKNGKYTTWGRVIVGFILYMLLGFIFSMLALWFVDYETKFGGNVLFFGVVGWGVSIVIGIIVLLNKIVTFIRDKREKNRDKLTIKVEKPNIMAEFFKSKREKYCKKIEWED